MRAWVKKTLRKTPKNKAKPVSSPAGLSIPQPCGEDGNARTEAAPATKLAASALGSTLSDASGPQNITTRSPEHVPTAKDRDLWGRAYGDLQIQKPSLVKDFDAILLEELTSTFSSKAVVTSTAAILGRVGTPERHEQMAALIEKKLQDQEDSVMKLRFGKTTIVVRDQIDRAIKVITFVKDFVASVVSSDPHASLAWSGICILLPLFLNPGKQYEANVNGITSIASLVHRLSVVERIYHEETCNTHNSSLPADVVNLRDTLENGLVKLYRQILEYQALSLRQWARSKAAQLGRDMFAWDNWDKLLSDIKDSELEVTKAQCVLDSDVLRTGFTKQEATARELYDALHEDYMHVRDTTDKVLKLAQNQENRDKVEEDRNKAEKERQCLAAFQSSEYDFEAIKNRNAINVKGTCQWFLHHRKFCEWEDSPGSALLLVTADPGCGKSVLSKYLIDEGKLSKSDDIVTLCYWFFKDEDIHTSSSAKALRAILYQLFCRKRNLLRHALRPFEEKGAAFVNQFESLWAIFESAITDGEAGRVVCIFDALDECSEDTRNPFIKKLASFYRIPRTEPQLKIIVTSRPYDRIRDTFFLEGLDPEAVILAGENDAERDDISKEVNLVVQSRIENFKRLREWKIGEQDDAHLLILDRLSTVTNRTYLWVSLIFPELEKHAATAKEDFAKILTSLPQTIYAAYEKILCQSLDEPQARKALHIILAAASPLSLDEINVALSIKEGGTCELKPRASFRELLRQLCGLFVHVIDENVYLFHQSARDFLLPASSEILPYPPSGPWQHSFKPKDSNKTLALACIWYLQGISFQDNSKLLDGLDGTIYQADGLLNLGFNKTHFWKYTSDEVQFYRTHCFFQYAAQLWAEHYAATNTDQVITDAANDICKVHSSIWKLWFRQYLIGSNCEKPWFPSRGNALLLRTELGHADAVQTILKNTPEPIDGDEQANRALAMEIASTKNREDIIRLLVDHKTPIVREPLRIALKNSNWSLMRLFLKSGADINLLSPPEIISCDDLDLVKLMLDLGANPSAVWFEAISQAKPGHVRTLLDHDVNKIPSRSPKEMRNLLNWKDSRGYTGLHLAIASCQPDLESILDHPHDTLQLLLSRSQDLKYTENPKLIFIPWPREQLHLRLVKLFLRCKVNPLEATATNDTLLHFVVRQIINVWDNDDEVLPPEYYIRHDEDVVKLCLSAGFDAEIQDTEGKTPMDYTYGPEQVRKYGPWSDYPHPMQISDHERQIPAWLHIKAWRLRAILSGKVLAPLLHEFEFPGSPDEEGMAELFQGEGEVPSDDSDEYN